MTTGQAGPASLNRVPPLRPAYTLRLITVASPAQATRRMPFTLQLRGPFNAGEWAGLSPSPALCATVSALTIPLRSLWLYSICVWFIAGTQVAVKQPSPRGIEAYPVGGRSTLRRTWAVLRHKLHLDRQSRPSIIFPISFINIGKIADVLRL